MLPPVRTISGSSGSYQNSSSVAASAHLAGEPIFPGQAADADRDVNPNLAGKLNILLLSGRDTVAEGLTMLADALGRSIALPRRMGEGGAAYVQRLAGMLSALSPAARQEAERQLNQLLRGVRLQLVIDAFLNPSGPEAARVVALLEMAGLKERDLATRTVLTSYRQNDGADFAADMPEHAGFDGRETMAAPPSQARSGSAAPQAAGSGASATSAAAGAAAASSGDPAAVTASGSLSGAVGAGETLPVAQPEPGGYAPAPAAPVGDMPLVDAEEMDDEPELVMFHHEVDNIFSRTSEHPLEMEPKTGHAAVMDAQSRISIPATMDARSLQSVLETAFLKGENTDPLIQAKAAMQLLAREEGEPATETGSRDYGSKPFIDYTRPPPRPAHGPEPLTSVLALKGWIEDEIIALPILPASLEAEAALAAALSPHAGPEPDIGPMGLQLRGRGVAANDMPQHKAALAAAEQQLLRNADEAAGLAADRRVENAVAHAAQRSQPEAPAALAQQIAQELRQAIPYALHPYPPVNEHEDSRRDRAGFRSSQDDDEGDEDRAEDESQGDADSGAHHSAGDDADAGHRMQASSEDRDEAGADMADPAFDYYQRMAGWT